MTSRKEVVKLRILNVLYYILFLMVYGNGVNLGLYFLTNYYTPQYKSNNEMITSIVIFVIYYVGYSIILFKFVYIDIKTNVDIRIENGNYKGIEVHFKKCGLSLTVKMEIELIRKNYNIYKKELKVPIYFINKTLKKKLKNINVQDAIFLLYKLGQEEFVNDLMLHDIQFQKRIRADKIKSIL